MTDDWRTYLTPAEQAEVDAAPDQLTTLRAEVERLRDVFRTELRDSRFDLGYDSEPHAIGTGQLIAYDRVLDLIDKQREGQ